MRRREFTLFLVITMMALTLCDKFMDGWMYGGADLILDYLMDVVAKFGGIWMEIFSIFWGI